MKRRWKWLGLGTLITVALIVAAFAALGGWTSSASRARTDLDDVVDLSAQPAEMVTIYRFIENHSDMAKQIPCYCGCGPAIAHASLLDCFVIKPSVYSEHASGCMVCGNEANDVQRLVSEGRSSSDIRDWIDREYAKYGKPTDTPQRGSS